MTSRTHAAVTYTDDERHSLPALHNSGPAPGHVYSTGAVGVELGLSAAYTVRALLERVRVRRVLRYYLWNDVRYLSPTFIGGAAYAALSLLSADTQHPARGELKRVVRAMRDMRAPLSPPTQADLDAALAALTLLKSHLLACGQLAPFAGIVRWSALATPSAPVRAPWIASDDNAPLTQLAWQLVAIAHAAPPLLLFSRSPSLEFFRDSGVLTLRWFGARVAGEGQS